MFDLGFRQAVINDGTVIKAETIGATDYINIEGFGKFVVGGSSLNENKVPVDAVLGSTAILGAPAGWADDQIWEIALHINQGEGDGGLGNIRDSGAIVRYQIGKVRSINGGSVPVTFSDMVIVAVNGFKADPTVADPFEMITTDGASFTFESGYEGFTIENILATKIYDPTIPNFDDRMSVPIDITGAITEGNFGFGYPTQIEASIRNATPYTQSQYDVHTGGNEPVEFFQESRYTEISWITEQDQYADTAPHAMLGYGDANTETLYTGRKYSIYIKSENESGALNAAEIILLNSI